MSTVRSPMEFIVCIRSLLSTALFFLLCATNANVVAGQDFEDFARCLKDRGMVMYSANWCQFCLMQLNQFDPAYTARDMKSADHRTTDRFPFVTECTSPGGPKGKFDNPQCKDLQGVPAWKLPDGNIRYGVHTTEELARHSGCPAPKKGGP